VSAPTAGEPRKRGLNEDARGAVYVEFLVAFIPFLIFFLCLWQVSILYYAKLMVDHAAFSAARAAAVVVAECPSNVGDNGGVNTLTANRQSYISAAAYIALAPLILDGTIGTDPFGANFIEYPTTPGGADSAANGATPSYPSMTPPGSVSNIRTRVNATFICRIAFANVILCNGFWSHFSSAWKFFPPSLPISSEAVFPFQGVSYTYSSNCQ
jgi:Flp pilus assembly protein TadG